MSFLSMMFSSLRKAYSAVFRQHLSVRVAKQGVRVVLQERPAVPNRQQPPSRAEAQARKDQQSYTLMRQQLAELLDELPETRATMRHLVFVERALERKGLRAFNKLPLDVLQRALDQLEGLVVNWSPAGLATLRSRMAVAIIDRDNLVGDAGADTHSTAAVMDTMPLDDFNRGVEVHTDDDALAAAYAALGDLAPSGIELQPALQAVPAGEIRVHALNG